MAEGKDLTYWQRIADITDSVGYPLAYVAATHGVPCSIVKIVAGAAGMDGKTPDLSALSEKMAEFLDDAYTSISSDK